MGLGEVHGTCERYYGEEREGAVPFAHINDHTLESYLNGEIDNNIKMVLDCYDFDSSIKEFYIVSYLCAETLPVGASQLFLIKITKSGRDCIVPTELEDAPMKLFKDLKPLELTINDIENVIIVPHKNVDFDGEIQNPILYKRGQNFFYHYNSCLLDDRATTFAYCIFTEIKYSCHFLYAEREKRQQTDCLFCF